jgi:hypothetical protein
MKLKKINEKLREGLVENRITEANTLQKETFLFLKAVDCVIISPKEGKSTTIVINVIQQLVCEENNHRALIVEDKAKVLEMEAIFEN